MITGIIGTFSLTYATTHAHVFHLTAKSDNFAKKCLLFVDFFFRFQYQKRLWGQRISHPSDALIA